MPQITTNAWKDSFRSTMNQSHQTHNDDSENDMSEFEIKKMETRSAKKRKLH